MKLRAHPMALAREQHEKVRQAYRLCVENPTLPLPAAPGAYRVLYGRFPPVHVLSLLTAEYMVGSRVGGGEV